MKLIEQSGCGITKNVLAVSLGRIRTRKSIVGTSPFMLASRNMKFYVGEILHIGYIVKMEEA